MKSWLIHIVLSAMLLGAYTAVQGADAGSDAVTARWPAWRGPQSSGSTSGGSYPAGWQDGENILWKVELPGAGCSTPAVWNEHILVTCPVDGQDALLDLDWSGRVRWQTSVGPEKPGKHRNGSGSNPSPVTDGRLVFAYFKSGHLAGLDLEGKLLWKTNLQERFGRDTLYWDIGTSPVLVDGAVVAAVMHSGESYLAAFDKETGALVWKVARNYKTPVEGDHSYATPIVIEHQGRQAILVWGAEHLTAHAADDGRVLWSCGGFNPQRKGNWVAVASAVVADQMAIVPYGRGSHLAGVRLGGEGDVTATHRVWTREDAGAFVPTPAVSGGRLYLLGDSGQVTCLDPSTGSTLWSERLPKHRAKYYASPVVADGKLYAPREDGVVLVAQVEGSFALLSENDMGERVIASPVPVGGRLLIRGQQHLFCIGR